jgi:hypothetical protein
MEIATRLAVYSGIIARFLGVESQKISIISSILLAAISFFYIFTLASYIQVTVYIFIRRVTYINPFDDYLITKYLDGVIISSLSLIWLVLFINEKVTKLAVCVVYGMLLITAVVANFPTLIDLTALTSLPIIVFFLSYRVIRAKGKKLVQNITLTLVSHYFVIISIVMGIISIGISLSIFFQPRPQPIHNYGYDLFLLFSSLSPVLLILIFFCFPVKLLMNRIVTRILKLKQNWQWSYDSLNLSDKLDRVRPKKTRAVYLLIFVLISICLALLPQLPPINKDNQQIGTDSFFYVEFIVSLQQSENLQDFLKTAFIDLHRGDRPISVIFMFLLTTFIDAPVLDTLEYLPIILGPSLVLVVYFLTRELTSSETTSLFAAFLTGIGNLQVSIGIFAGFYANWVALIVGYASLVFFFRFLKTSSKISLFIFSILVVTTLFSHAYTWSILMIIMGIFLGISFFMKYYPRKRIILLLVIVLSSVVIDVVKTMIVESAGSSGGVELVAELAQRSVKLQNLAVMWDTLIFATQHKFGGIFCNFIVIGLVFYWLMRSNLRIHFNMFITVFLMIGIGPLLFGDWIVQSRVFYNIPFQIPAAIALTYISRERHSSMIMLPIYVWLIAMSIWTVSNFYEVLR